MERVIRFTFDTDKGAWAFMRACDTAGFTAGHPELLTPAVRVVFAEGAEDLAVKLGAVSWEEI